MFSLESRRAVVSCLLTSLLIVSTAAAADDDGGAGKLVTLLPKSTNAIVAMDVNAVMQSPYAQQWGWTKDGAGQGGFQNPLAA